MKRCLTDICGGGQMKTIWKILVGLIIMLLGFAIWISTSILEAFAQLGGASSPLTRGGMSFGFLLIFLGPIIFWIVLPLKDKLYEKHRKLFIAILIPIILFLLILIAVMITLTFRGS